MNASSFVPPRNPVTAPYWEATKEKRLVLQKCLDCDQFVHHPREACPRCLGSRLDWVQSAGTGTIHASSVHARPFGGMSPQDCPYVVAFIDLDDGVRFLSNIVEVDPATVRTGERVELTWRQAGEGYHLPQFRPVHG